MSEKVSDKVTESAIERLEKMEEIKKGAISDLKEERKTVAKRLEYIDGLLEKYGVQPKTETTKERKPRKSSGGVTVKDAILQVLEVGKSINVPAITEKVNAIRPNTDKTAVAQALMQLKKAKQVKSEMRGMYSKAK